MAVYTDLNAETLANLIGEYDVGELVSAKGIAEGVSNSNWLIETSGKNGGKDYNAADTGARYILTMYERRIELDDLPFFLGLLDHLSAKGCPVPRTIHDKSGAAFRWLDDKAVALIEFLPGVSIDHPTPAQAHAVGAALAGIHLAAQDFPENRTQTLGPAGWRAAAQDCTRGHMDEISPGLGAAVFAELDYLDAHWPQDLPSGVSHCDLFPDNVLMLGEKVTGLIDFYFAANDAFAYDLAVTHAAWCFADAGGTFREDIAAALISGYSSVRQLSENEIAALPVLARGAAMRFVTSRAFDWIDTPADALVTRKDPMDFIRRLHCYSKRGVAAFPGVSV